MARWASSFQQNRREFLGCGCLGLAGLTLLPLTGIIQKVTMTQSPQSDHVKWRLLLQELSNLALNDEELRDRLTPEQIEKRWLGEHPASEAEISAAEARLGVRLPPSYRAFLSVSNGWNHPNSFVIRLASTTEIAWTRDVQPNLVSAWQRGAQEASENGDIPPGPEDHIAKTLMISRPHEDDDGSYFMLNPATVQGEEMEAWFFAHWVPGAQTHSSFGHCMNEVRDSIG